MNKLLQKLPQLATGALVGLVIGLLAKELDLPALASYWYSRSPLVLLAAIVAAPLWLLRIGRILLSTKAALLFLCWLLVAFTPLTASMGASLPRRDALQKADAVFVLASSLQDDGELGVSSMSRLLHGLELLQQGYADRLILSELYPPQRSYAEAAGSLMKALGIQKELLTVGPVGNTHDEALALGVLFREKGWKRLIVVTSPVHSTRASAVIAAQGIEVISSPCTEIRYDLENLDSYDDRINAFGSLSHEYLGLFVYRRRGWIP